MANLCLCIMLFFIPYVAVSQTVVKFLPGYEGPLPFYLETGYVGVGESDDIQLFYYFIKSESNPQEDPLMLWLSGGPGCSSFKGLVYEIGPVSFRAEKYNGSLPTLVLNPYSWTKTSNIIFLDSPVGAGFSYARIPSVSWSSDTLQPQLIHEFLKKWLIVHPEFSTNAFYVGGDSYSGIIVPGVVQEISNGNECNKRINLQGYILGNPITDRDLEVKMEVPFAHGMGLISDEIYESLKSSCGGEYDNIDPNNANCLKAKDEYNKCIAKINTRHILEPECPFPWATFPKRRSLYKKFEDFQSAESLLQTYVCGVTRNYAYALSTYWANDHAVREALHIRKGTVGLWEGCITANYTCNVDSSFQYHVNLSSKGYHSLVYSGDHDFLVPFLSTQAWIRNLNYSIIDDWRPWIVEGQVAGYTRTYSNRMTFATVKGGGHTAPEYRPKECFSMFKRWISHETI